jgi:hypothetical protein
MDPTTVKSLANHIPLARLSWNGRMKEASSGVAVLRLVRGRAGAASGEKNLKQGDGFFGAHARCDLHAMVRAIVAQNFEAGANRAAFGLFCAVDETGYARLDHCPGTHRAGLDCDVERGAEQAIITDTEGCVTQRENFGVGGGIAMCDGAVPGACDDFFVENEHGADGDFAAFGSFASFGERFGHEYQIVFGNFRHCRKDITT